jgi:hypothetical protein
MATCDDCVLWSEPQPGDEGRCRHHTLRKCRGGRDTRLACASWRYSRTRQHWPRNSGIYQGTWCALCRDDRWYNWLPSPRGNRLPRRMVPCLRVLAWTRSLYRADASLIRAASARGILVKILQRGARDFDSRSLVCERAASKLFRCYGRDRGFESVSLQRRVVQTIGSSAVIGRSCRGCSPSSCRLG